MNTRTRAVIAALVLAVLAGSLGACGPTAPPVAALTPSTVAVTRQHSGTVRVAVAGGCDTCAPGRVMISDSAYADAVVAALRSSNVFAGAQRTADADYLLNIQIFHTDSPLFGGAMRATIETGWTLTRPGSPAHLWQESIRSEHTAAFSEAFVGVERVRLAWEGAVRTNIAEGVARLSRQTLATETPRRR